MKSTLSGGVGRGVLLSTLAALPTLAGAFARMSALGLVALGTFILLPGLVQAAEPGRLLLVQAQVHQAQALKGARTGCAKASSPMSRCLATWDRTSQMSKQEWRQTCKRVVKENPGLYSKPF
jgi:hypothetical protein